MPTWHEPPAQACQVIRLDPGLAFGTGSVVLSAADNALIGVTPAAGGPFARFEAWFFGLHYARFGGSGVKLLYALLAFASCAVIVTGNLVWLERRDAQRVPRRDAGAELPRRPARRRRRRRR